MIDKRPAHHAIYQRTRKAADTLWTVLVGGVSLLIFGWIVGGSLERAMLRNLDATLREEVENVLTGLRERATPLDWRNDIQVREFFSTVVSLYSFEVERPVGSIPQSEQAFAAMGKTMSKTNANHRILSPSFRFQVSEFQRPKNTLKL